MDSTTIHSGPENQVSKIRSSTTSRHGSSSSVRRTRSLSSQVNVPRSEDDIHSDHTNVNPVDDDDRQQCHRFSFAENDALITARKV